MARSWVAGTAKRQLGKWQLKVQDPLEGGSEGQCELDSKAEVHLGINAVGSAMQCTK